MTNLIAFYTMGVATGIMLVALGRDSWPYCTVLTLVGAGFGYLALTA